MKHILCLIGAHKPKDHQFVLNMCQRKSCNTLAPGNPERDGYVEIWKPIAWFLIFLIGQAVSDAFKEAHAAEGFATYYTVASCQKEGTSGILTANGEHYDETAMTCALPIKLKYHTTGKNYFVCGKETGGCVEVRHNDFGPGRKPRKNGVVIDLTPAAFKIVCGELKQGKCSVGVQEVVE